ncbi:MAG: hypothetical protein HWE25_16780 [Alphaproteobacteria bacterium]|nr:hypothetical protein [Alphaproteobacteria bacterium]
MTDKTNNSALEDARARLESAMSRLAQEVAGARAAKITTAKLSAEKATYESRIASLEQENLKLHEQVATLSLQDNTAADDGALAALKEEKQALEHNYNLLKRQYATLQDEMEAREDAAPAPEGGDAEMEAKLRGENAELKKAIMALKAERDTIRDELDTAIAKLEPLVKEA